jgi:hypothetical protein
VPLAIRARRPSQVSPAPVRSFQTGVAQAQALPVEHEFAIAPTPPPSGSAASNRDEIAYWQAENQSLSREVQMLRTRIRELGELLYWKYNPASVIGIDC